MKTEEFYKLSREDRAVLVAKDVLSQLAAKKYVPQSGTYIEFTDGVSRKGQIKDEFSSIEKCKVCALGSIIMSSTHFGNRLTFEGLGAQSCMTTNEELPAVSELLKSVFDPHMLLLIETAFEDYSPRLSDEDSFSYYNNIRYAHYFGETLSFEECVKCHEFYESFSKYNDSDDDFDGDDYSEDSENRLFAIMKNIIDNKGNFVL